MSDINDSRKRLHPLDNTPSTPTKRNKTQGSYNPHVKTESPQTKRLVTFVDERSLPHIQDCGRIVSPSTPQALKRSESSDVWSFLRDKPRPVVLLPRWRHTQAARRASVRMNEERRQEVSSKARDAVQGKPGIVRSREEHARDHGSGEGSSQSERRSSSKAHSLIAARLQRANLKHYDIKKLEGDVFFDRAFISALYGGNPQSTFPAIARHRVRDGIDSFAFLNLEYNPLAPRRPGAPGLFFVINPHWSISMIHTVFVRISTANWLYVGNYWFVPSGEPLSATEFNSLSRQVQATWAQDIRQKIWGRSTVARVYFRKRSDGREPSTEDIESLCSTNGEFKKCKDDVSEEDILRAFRSGQEHLLVSHLKCAGYSHRLHQTLIEEYPAFLERRRRHDEAQSVHGHEKRAGRSIRRKGPRGSKRRKADDIQRRLKAAGMASDASDLSDLSETDSENGTDDVEEELEVEGLLGLSSSLGATTGTAAHLNLLGTDVDD